MADRQKPASQKPGKQGPAKHVPQRTCIACRQVQGKRSLVRLVRVETQNENGEAVLRIEVDSTGKRAGRGMYLHGEQACWQTALRTGKFEQALRSKLSAENRKTLMAYMETLPSGAESSTAEKLSAETAPTAGNVD